MNLNGEIWKPIPGFKGIYDVSNKGRVRSYYAYNCRWRVGKAETPQRILQRAPHRSGYQRFVLIDIDGNGREYAAHRLVMMAFIGPCPEGMEINHIDGDRLNNNVENLEYCTRSDNAKHAYENDLWEHPVGERNGRAKLTDRSVKTIRKKYEGGGYTHRQLAKMFGVDRSTIGRIIARKDWKHI